MTGDMNLIGSKNIAVSLRRFHFVEVSVFATRNQFLNIKNKFILYEISCQPQNFLVIWFNFTRIPKGGFREVSFFTRRGGLLKIGGDQVLCLRSKGGSKDFFQIKKGGSLIFFKEIK